MLEVGASIGIALYPEHGTDARTLLRRADVAMYAAKQKQSGYSFHREDADVALARSARARRRAARARSSATSS